MNPILPRNHYIPDVEARVFGDRLYLYGSMDTGGDTFWCSDRYRVFSSDDLNTWQDHGVSFHLSDCHRPHAQRLFAPDCEKIGDRYVLFYCTNEGGEGIAFSDKPEGPFGQAQPIAGVDGGGIDPAVLVDGEDVYLFWGQNSLKGAKLKPGLSGIVESSTVEGILRRENDGFHEGASIRRVGELYYLVYTDIAHGKATRLSYATSRDPLGPYTKGGVIIDCEDCDPQSWNNHGSICYWQGQWYIFYHRSSRGSKFNRRVYMEPITIAADGSIQQVEMTTQGVGRPLPASAEIEAFRACELHGKVHCCVAESPTDEHEYLAGAEKGDSAAFRYIDFGKGAQSVHLTVASATPHNRIEVRLDAEDGPLLAAIDSVPDHGWGHWQTLRADTKTMTTGTHAVYLCFDGPRGRLANIKSLAFQ